MGDNGDAGELKMATFQYDKEIPVPEHVISYVDPAVKKMLPPGTNFHGIYASGASFWARTAKIDATNEEGEDTPYFIKVHQYDKGKDMVSSEFKSQTLLHAVMPELAVKAIGWGEYEEEPEVYFYLCHYVELIEDDPPPVNEFADLIAEFHTKGEAPDMKFGLPYAGYSGSKPQAFPECDTWEECFTRGLSGTFDEEEETHGADPELTELRKALMEKVIPRLLRPLETEGRKVIPTLIHGDLWDGNVAINAATGRPVIYDPAPLYAHNELDLAGWWAPRHKITGDYIDRYANLKQKSEPIEDFEDRGLLYRVNWDAHCSSLYVGCLKRRNITMDTMRYLVTKYPDGYEGYLAERGH